MKEMKETTEKIIGYTIGAVIGVGISALFYWIIMLLWNWLMPKFFGLPTLTFLEVAGFGVLFTLLMLFIQGLFRKRRQRPILLKDRLLQLGWVDKGDVLVRYSNPRIGWKPADGTLIIGYQEWPEKVFTIEKLNEILCKTQID